MPSEDRRLTRADSVLTATVDNHHPTAAQDTLGQQAIAMPTLTFAPSKRPLRVRRRVHAEARTWSDARCPSGGVSRS